MDSKDNAYKQIVENQKDWMEKMLLVISLNDPSFFYQHLRGIVCCKKQDGRDVYKDFSRSASNILFDYIQRYYELIKDQEEKSAIPQVWIQGLLQADIENNNILPEEGQFVKSMYEEYVRTDYNSGIKDIIENCIPYWLNLQRARMVVSKHANKNSSVELLIKDLSYEQKNIAGNDYSLDFGDNLILDGHSSDEYEIMTTRIPFGITKLDSPEITGGGIARKESAMFVVPSGGGKTVMATQLLGTFALNGYNALLITTEQPPAELKPRLISCHCNILFNKIKDGAHVMNLTEEEKLRVAQFQAATKGKLAFRDWSEKSKNIIDHLEAELDQFADKVDFIPDVVIFDWLGGGLGWKTFKETQLERSHYMRTAEYFATIMKRRDMAGIVMVQADATQAKNKQLVDNSHITKAKQLHEHFALGFGISCLMATGGGKNELLKSGGLYRKIQYINPFKVRKGEPIHFKIKRRFEYQRFENCPENEQDS